MYVFLSNTSGATTRSCYYNTIKNVTNNTVSICVLSSVLQYYNIYYVLFQAASLHQNMEMLHDLVCTYCQFIGYTCPAKCPATGVILGKYSDRAAATTCGGVITLVTERKLTSLMPFLLMTLF